MPEMSTGQAIKKALSLCLDNYEEAFLAGEDINIWWSIWSNRWLA